jgi:hypothetical protein
MDESAISAIWTDDDLGDASDDAIGCDTNLNLTYTYNFDNNDPRITVCHRRPWAFKFVRGPLIQSPGDTVAIL